MGGQRLHNAAVRSAGALLLAAIAAAVLPVAASAAPLSGPHARAPKGGASSAPSPLLYGGGKLVPTSTTYAIWWGPSSAFPADAQDGIETLLGGFGGSSYLAVADQYMPGGATASAFATSLFDPSAPPSHGPNTATVVNEVAAVLARNGLSPSPNAVYLVYTSNFPHLNFCAWHAAGTIGTTTVQVGYLPNTAGVAGCDPGNLFPKANSYSEGTRSLADSTAHEFMESVTDPIPVSGWADKNGQEIGDKCNFVYSTAAPIRLSNGSKWQIQEEWSNAAGGCVPGA